MKTVTALIWIALAGAIIAADQQEIKALPEGPGKEAVVKACLECHGAANFRKARKEPGEWSDSVDDMVDRGAKIPTGQTEAVVAYLVKNFGAGAKVQMNSAPLEEIKMVLGFTVPEAQAVVDYRELHGAYKDWREVAKVRGVDVEKVEAKKDSMAF
ncbi:MAG TPA: helix-hairpin-helix domain-containing protein [Candidatus Solibacter sp.]|nr:helix-hairpin-helix domain-containing protein [Candidatus Solibacter sp.]